MTDMQEIIDKAKEWALEEVDKNKSPLVELVEFSYEQGVRLAEELGVDIDIVKIGSWLVDIKLGEAKNQGKIEEHSKIGAEATRIFLVDFEINEKIKEKIVNCVEAHHGQVPYTCLEAEICANADGYRFIHPKGVFIYFEHLSNKEKNIEKNLEQLEYKLDEKWNILSLDICKKELESHYWGFKNLIAAARKTII